MVWLRELQSSQFPSDIERGRVNVGLEEMNSATVTPGSRTLADFCAWIQHAEQHIKDAVITDISWWECQLGLKHQSILLRLEHTDPNTSNSRAYYLTLERAGRTTFDPRAIDKATISESCTVGDEEFLGQHLLLFALLRKCDSEIIPRDTNVVIPAFYDFLDHKWRGPPATLADLASYLQVIVSLKPNYAISSSNCFWFSRHIFHIIGLLHYSFSFIAFEIHPKKFIFPRNLRRRIASITTEEWAAHDPSSIGLLFRFLHYEEWRNGFLLLRRLSLIMAVLIAGGVSTGFGLIFYPYIFHSYPGVEVSMVVTVGTTILAICGILLLQRILFPPVLRLAVTLLTKWIIRRPTAAVIKQIESHRQPDAVRGDFIPVSIPMYHRLSVKSHNHRDNGYVTLAPHISVLSGQRPPSWLSEWFKVYFKPLPIERERTWSYTRAVFPCPRELPEPWEHEAQIYAPGRVAYDLALEELQDQNQDCIPLSKCTSQQILQQKRLSELIRIAVIDQNSVYSEEILPNSADSCMKLLEICKLPEGAVQAVAAGAVEMIELSLALPNFGWQSAVIILDQLLPHLSPSMQAKLISMMHEHIKDPKTVEEFVETAGLVHMIHMENKSD
ncbi:hypothetical protein C8F01DRAFT_1233992, partial [Mycena amicta]